jgi:hypothetical protein
MGTIAKNQGFLLVPICLLMALHAGCGCDVVAASLFSVSPGTINSGGASVIITLSGSGFRRDSQVFWNDVLLQSTFVSSTELTAAVPATQLQQSGSVSVFVFNPTGDGGATVSGGIGVVGISCDGGRSNPVNVMVTP